MRGTGDDEEAVRAFADFGCCPTWMWRDADILDFVGWLRAHNETRPLDQRAGFHGLDLHGLRASTRAVLAHLDRRGPPGALGYGCFDRFGEDLREHGYVAHCGMDASCEREAVAPLVELY